MTTKGKFLRNVNDKRDTALHLDFHRAVKRASKPGGDSLYELLDGEEECIPYTDSDHYCDGPDRPPQEFIDDLQDKILQNWCVLVGPQGYDGCELLLATRHGLVSDKNRYKLSFRFFLRGFKVRPHVLGEWIKRKGLAEGKLGDFDPAPYGKTSQLLGCVGFYKSQNDLRVLVPYHDRPLELFLIQNLTGDERPLEYYGGDETMLSEETSEGEATFESPRFAPPWEILERTVMALSVDKRCKEGTYQRWSEVGWAVAGVARVAGRWSDGFQLWTKFCMQCPTAFDASKAWSIYHNAETTGRQLGWKGVLDWLNEDDPNMCQSIKRKLALEGGQILDDLAELKAVKSFVNRTFSHPPKSVDKVVVMTYEQGKFMVVFLNDRSCCQFIGDDHVDGTLNRIVIGLKTARDKCSHPSCTSKTNKVVDFAAYPDTIKKIAQKYLVVVETPDGAVRKFVMERKETDFKGMDDETTELGPLQKLPFCKKYQLTRNTWCPVCRCKHDKPENCLLLNETAKMLTIGCRLDPDRFHPPGGLVLPPNVTNVFINQVNINTAADSAQTPLVLSSDYEHDELPFFKDEPEKLTAFVRSFSGQHYDVAIFAQALWGTEFRFFNDKWHRFQNHFWETLDGMPVIRHRLSKHLCDLYEAVLRYYRDRPGLTNSKEKKAALERTIVSLKTASFKDAVMKEVKEIFQIENEGFGKEVNRADLLPFTNGVLDLGTYEFRPGRPEDKMSMSTRVPYEVFDNGIDACREMTDFIESIMPNEDVRHFLLRVSSLCLSRQVKHQTVVICTGKGANGKTIYLDLLAEMLGDFAKSPPAKLLTGKRESAGSTNESLVELDGARLATFNEPDGMGVIQADVLKVMSGGRDKISARALYERQRTFQPTFKMFLACNVIPRMSEDTDAVWRRVQVIHFPMKFCEEPDPNNPLEGLMDVDLSDRLEIWAPYLASYLLPHLQRVRRSGLRKPAEVTRSTTDYRQDCDAYADFWTEKMEQHGDPLLAVGRTAVKDAFKAWIAEKRLPALSAGQMKAYLDGRLPFQDTTKIVDGKVQRIKGYVKWGLRTEPAGPFVIEEESD